MYKKNRINLTRNGLHKTESFQMFLFDLEKVIIWAHELRSVGIS